MADLQQRYDMFKREFCGAAEKDVLSDGEMREERRVLRHIADGALARGHIDAARRGKKRAPTDLDLARFDTAQPGDGFQQSGFAGARRSNNSRRSTFECNIDVERECGERNAASEQHGVTS